jgi:hypothetical protein
MLNNSTIDAKRLKSMLVKTRGNEKLRIAVMLAVLAVCYCKEKKYFEIKTSW